MSAQELIERYGLDDMVGGWVRHDVKSAQAMVAAAAGWRMKRVEFANSGETYLKHTPDMHVRDYMGQARALGWRIARVIDEIVRAEEAAAADVVAAGDWTFLEAPCVDETCADCERPLWHHLSCRSGLLLCPFGRQFWQLARALVSEREYTTRELHKSMLGDIASRA